MSHVLLPTITRRLQVLLAVIVIAAAALASQASSAHAVEYYECGSCAAVNGNQIHLAEPTATLYDRAQNLSGKGVCSKAWILLSGVYHEFAKCTETGTEISVSGSVECGLNKCEGHGQSVRWFQQFTYKLWGEQHF